MHCPQCGSEMRPGMANAETWIGGFRLLDLFARRPGIYFCPDDRDEASVYVGGSRQAFCCSNCQTIVIPDRRGKGG
jgi:hypothetical protein